LRRSNHVAFAQRILSGCGNTALAHRMITGSSAREALVSAQSRKDIVAWVGSHVLPHEAAVRAWLKRWTRHAQDIDDVIQEAYSRLAALDSVAHIGSGRAYLFQTTRNIVLEQLRRSKIVRIDNVTDFADLSIVDETPPLDRIVGGARELQRVERQIDRLPFKCRRVFIMRRIHGVSQRDIARHLGISESAVEKQATRGLKLILKAMEGDGITKDPEEESSEHSRDRTGHR
jgi:RNA polymerase sigma factor (sigma-70 family)